MSSSDTSSQILTDNVSAVTDMQWFVESARRYVLQGLSLDEMCDVNAEVAFSLQRNQVRSESDFNWQQFLNATGNIPNIFRMSREGTNGKILKTLTSYFCSSEDKHLCQEQWKGSHGPGIFLILTETLWFDPPQVIQNFIFISQCSNCLFLAKFSMSSKLRLIINIFLI